MFHLEGNKIHTTKLANLKWALFSPKMRFCGNASASKSSHKPLWGATNSHSTSSWRTHEFSKSQSTKNLPCLCSPARCLGSRLIPLTHLFLAGVSLRSSYGQHFPSCCDRTMVGSAQGGFIVLWSSRNSRRLVTSLLKPRSKKQRARERQVLNQLFILSETHSPRMVPTFGVDLLLSSVKPS